MYKHLKVTTWDDYTKIIEDMKKSNLQMTRNDSAVDLMKRFHKHLDNNKETLIQNYRNIKNVLGDDSDI